MTLGEIISLIAILLIIGGAVVYIIKAKKGGSKCVGCPHAKDCGGKSSLGCSCSHEKQKRN